MYKRQALIDWLVWRMLSAYALPRAAALKIPTQLLVVLHVRTCLVVTPHGIGTTKGGVWNSRAGAPRGDSDMHKFLG